MSNNAGFVDSGIMQLRVDTQQLLSDVRAFLKGIQYTPIVDRETGQVSLTEDKVGEALLNDYGVNSIVGRLRLIFSPHVVQGNFTKTDAERYICDLDINISCDLMHNLEAWGCNLGVYDHVINGIIESAEAFISRLIDNKERDSYSSTIRSVESNTVQQSKGLFGGG